MPAPTRAEFATIGGIPFPCPAWEVRSLLPLWHSAKQRGDDLLIPGAPGVRAYPRRSTITKRSLELIIYGFFDVDGNVNADVREGLEENVDYLKANVVAPVASATGTRVCVLTLPSGATKTGDVHVEDLDLGEFGPTSVRGTLFLSLPDGELT